MMCHIVIRNPSQRSFMPYSTVRMFAFLVLAALVLLALLAPALFAQIAVRGGLLAGGIAAALALRPHQDSASP